jgi:hypothetical protein
MKHNVLRNVAHNISSSLASGIGLMIGVYEMYVFEELESSGAPYMTIDFLNGSIIGGKPSKLLKRAVELYRQELPNLCKKQKVDVGDFQQLKTTYFKGAQHLFFVEIVDLNGRYSKDEYEGLENKKIAKTQTEIKK